MHSARLSSLLSLASRYRKRSSGVSRNCGRKRSSPEAQLEKILRLTEELPNGCINWMGARDQRGYGFVQFQLRQIRAPRFFFVAFNGDDDPKLEILHTCDSPPCVNPKHLRLGTHQENMIDMVVRNRRNHRKGSQINTAVLSEDQAAFIKRNLVNLTNKEFQIGMNVSYETITGIKSGRTWRHIL